jgi:uncharacterized HhH-GPD family protein
VNGGGQLASCAMPTDKPQLYLSGNAEADRLLSQDPLALLIGLVLDQQVPLEWAFAAPAELRNRLGGKLDARSIARMDPEDLVKVFLERPALHRYPASMARRVHDLSRLLVESYDGKAENVWSADVDATELLKRLKKLPGFGDQKARIFLAFLGKQLGVRPDGWVDKSTPYGEPQSFRSIADIVDGQSLERVRLTKQQAKQAARAAQAQHAETEPAAKTGRATKAASTKTGTTKTGTTKAASAKAGPAAKAAKVKKATNKASRPAKARGQASRTRA